MNNNLQLLCSAAAEAADGFAFHGKRYELLVRQQPKRSRVGSISEKLDRRPIDPPPILQLLVHDPADPFSQGFTVSPSYFVHVQLMDETGEQVIRQIKGHKADAMAGSMVSPLHTLRDESMAQGAYFVFSDLSVRMEGSFRLRFDLFELDDCMVHSRASVISDVFSVYSPKRFPGMMESTRLSKLFADQGLRIRIRTEAGTKKRAKKSSAASGSNAKRQRRNGESHTPCSSLGIRGVLEADIFGHKHANSSPTTSLTDSISGQRHPNPGMLVFQTDPFSPFRAEACHQPPHPIPPALDHHHGGQQYFAFNRDLGPNVGSNRPFSDILPVPSYEPKLRHPISAKQHTFNLSDIDAVALLDSLSQGKPAKSQEAAALSSSANSQVQQSRPLPQTTCPGFDYSAGFNFTATDMSAPLATTAPNHSGTPYRLHNMFQQTPGSFDSLSTPATGIDIPLSNYRLSAITSSDFKNPGTGASTSEATAMPHVRPPHDTLFSNSLFLGAPTKFHPILRTSSGGFSNVRSTDHSAFPQISLDHKDVSSLVPKSSQIDCRSSTTSSQSSDYSTDDSKTVGFSGSTGNAQFVNSKASTFSLPPQIATQTHLHDGSPPEGTRLGLDISFPQPLRSTLLHNISTPGEQWPSLGSVDIGMGHQPGHATAGTNATARLDHPRAVA